MITATPDLAQFRRCETAEDYFKFFGVPYDPRVVNVYRLHILRHFARQLEELHESRTAPLPSDRILADYRAALIRSYEAFTTGTALDHRVFKVLRDHAPRAFVPVAQVTVRRAEHKP
jgi:nitrogenase-stabilizing/protective protein